MVFNSSHDRTPRRAAPADSPMDAPTHVVRTRLLRAGIAAAAAGAAVLALATPGLAEEGSSTQALAPVASPTLTASALAATPSTNGVLAARAVDRVTRSSVRGSLTEAELDAAAQQRATQLGATASTISTTSKQIVAERKAEAAAKEAAKVAKAKKLAAKKAAKAKAAASRRAASFYWPTAGSITSPWGMRLHPILGYRRMHGGADIGGTCNQPIWAAQDGVVTKAASSSQSGNNLRIDHGRYKGAKVETAYLHMNRFSVRVGEKVTRGQVIGTVGSTGLSTACHLHFIAYRNSDNVNPTTYLR